MKKQLKQQNTFSCSLWKLNMRGQNKDFIVAGIRNLLKRNYNIEFDIIDIVAEVDSTLTFGENWTHIKDNYILVRCRDVEMS